MALLTALKNGFILPFTVYGWIYASVRKGMIKGFYSIVLRLLDVIEYFLDMHDAITKKVEKYERGKEVYDENQKVSDIFQCIDQDLKAKFNNNQVSFTVAQTQFESDISDQVITFDLVISNEGNGFDSNNGKFSCPIPGVYVFIFSSTSNASKDVVSLIQDDVEVDATLYGNNGGESKDGDQVSHMAFLQMKKNDQVWLKCAKDVDVKSVQLRFATFSGFLLYEQYVKMKD